MKRHSAGSVHGRFQPLHNGHIKYILAAKEYCDFLWIGITQSNIFSLVPSPVDEHRQLNFNNPMTYFERVEMISESLKEHSVKSEEFDIIPFPIEIPDYLTNYLPKDIPIFTTINDYWNEHKIITLERIGYRIIVLWEDRVKEINGITIRNLICSGDESWKDKVPLATIHIIDKYHIRERLLRLRNTVGE